MATYRLDNDTQRQRVFVLRERETGMYYIYGLRLEGDDEYRYVGSTSDPQHRLYGHLNEWKVNGGEKNEWVAAHLDSVVMDVLAEVESDPKLVERITIDRLRAEGHDLLNVRVPRRLTRQECQAYIERWFETKPAVSPSVLRQPRLL